MLESVLTRLARARTPTRTVLATSTETDDDAVADVGSRMGVQVVRGSLDDALDRFRLAAEVTDARWVVRITADCPLIDPDVVDTAAGHAHASGADYVTNTLTPRSFPDGLDVEVMSRRALVAAAREAREPAEREHVTLWIRARADLLPQAGLWLRPPHSEIRITLDTAEDLDELRGLVSRVGLTPRLPQILEAMQRVPTSESSPRLDRRGDLPGRRRPGVGWATSPAARRSRSRWAPGGSRRAAWQSAVRRRPCVSVWPGRRSRRTS